MIINISMFPYSNSDNLSVNVLHFTDYGKNFIKKQKLSPDSFIQMAMQYAFLLYVFNSTLILFARSFK